MESPGLPLASVFRPYPWLLLWALVLGSAIAVYYYLRIVFTMLRSGAAIAPVALAINGNGMAALVAIGIALLLTGIYPTPLIDLADRVYVQHERPMVFLNQDHIQLNRNADSGCRVLRVRH